MGVLLVANAGVLFYVADDGRKCAEMTDWHGLCSGKCGWNDWVWILCCDVQYECDDAVTLFTELIYWLRRLHRWFCAGTYIYFSLSLSFGGGVDEYRNYITCNDSDHCCRRNGRRNKRQVFRRRLQWRRTFQSKRNWRGNWGNAVDANEFRGPRVLLRRWRRVALGSGRHSEERGCRRPRVAAVAVQSVADGEAERQPPVTPLLLRRQHPPAANQPSWTCCRFCCRNSRGWVRFRSLSLDHQLSRFSALHSQTPNHGHYSKA